MRKTECPVWSANIYLECHLYETPFLYELTLLGDPSHRIDPLESPHPIGYMLVTQSPKQPFKLHIQLFHQPSYLRLLIRAR